MRQTVMTRAAYAYVLSALALVVTIVGCSTTHKSQTAQNEITMWEKYNRMPAQTSEDEVASSIEEATIEVNSVNVPPVKSQVTTYSKACGHLIQAESTHTALNNEDAHYFLRLNCSTVANATNKSGWVRFAPTAIKRGQKSALTKWRRKAVADNNSRRGVPYVCFHGQVTVPLCNGSGTSSVTEVRNFTSLSQTFASWKE